jgi:hypothetical protein
VPKQTRSEQPVGDAPLPTREQIEQRAYERFRARGEEHGRDQDDWLEAERELANGDRRTE